MGKIVISAFTR